MNGKIVAILGSESHTTSRYWAKMSINGQSVSWREALSKEWKTEYGDKHASWCECVFAVNDGDIVAFEAGSNTGNRGVNRARTNIALVFDSGVEVAEIDVAAGNLKGRLILKSDKDQEKADRHMNLIENL